MRIAPILRPVLQWAVLGAVVASCSGPRESVATRALGDSLLTLFDSMIRIHQAVPDTAMIRRMHPPADTIMFVEGSLVHRFTGDSLLKRVAAAHEHVTSMEPTIVDREVVLLDGDHAMLTGLERVNWTVDATANTWEGLLTLVVARRGDRWVVRGYRH